jgi:hypothetical protein
VVALNVYALGAAGQVIPGSTLRHAIAGAFRSSGVGLQALSGILAGPVNTNGELALPSNTQLTVQPFRAIIQNTQDATAGAYVVPSPTVQTFTAGAAAGQNIPAQDASQFRRALVVVHVDDAQVAGSGGNAGTLEVLPGPLAATAGAAIAAADAGQRAEPRRAADPAGRADRHPHPVQPAHDDPGRDPARPHRGRSERPRLGEPVARLRVLRAGHRRVWALRRRRKQDHLVRHPVADLHARNQDRQ